MARQTPGNLGFATTQISATPVQEVATKASTRPAQVGQQIDIGNLSQTYQRLVDERREFRDEKFSQIGTIINDGRRAGKSDKQILKELSESGDAPTNLLKELQKAHDSEGGLASFTNPAFRLELARGRANVFINKVQAELESVREEFATRIAAADSTEENEKVVAAVMAEISGFGQGEDFAELGVAEKAFVSEGLEQFYQQYTQRLFSAAAAIRKREYQAHVQQNTLDSLDAINAIPNTAQRAEAYDNFVEDLVARESVQVGAIDAAANAVSIYIGKIAAANPGNQGVAVQELEEILESAIDASGQSVFSRSAVATDRLEEQLAQLKFKAYQDTGTEAKLSNSKALEGAATSTAYVDLYASSRSAESLRDRYNQNREALLSAIETNDENTARYFGYDPESGKTVGEHLRLMLDWNRDTFQTLSGAAADATRRDFDSVALDAISIQKENGPDYTRGFIIAQGLPPHETQQLLNQVNVRATQFYERNSNQILQGIPFDVIARENLGDAASDEEIEEHAFRVRETAEKYISESPGFSGADYMDFDAVKAVRGPLKEILQDAYPPLGEEPSRSAPAVVPEQTPETRQTRARSLYSEAAAGFGSGGESFAGRPVDSATKTESKLADYVRGTVVDVSKDKTGFFTGLAPKTRRLMSRLDDVVRDEDLTDLEKREIVSHALVASGTLRVDEILSGSVSEAWFEHLPKYRREPTSDPRLADDTTGIYTEKFLEDLPLEIDDETVFTARIEDFKSDTSSDWTYLSRDRKEVYINKDKVPEEILTKARQVLEAAILEPNDANVAYFLKSQHENWSN